MSWANIFFAVAMFLFGSMVGLTYGERHPNRQTVDMIQCDVTCQMHTDKLVVVTPTAECICETSRLFIGEKQTCQ